MAVIIGSPAIKIHGGRIDVQEESEALASAIRAIEALSESAHVMIRMIVDCDAALLQELRITSASSLVRLTPLLNALYPAFAEHIGMLGRILLVTVTTLDVEIRRELRLQGLPEDLNHPQVLAAVLRSLGDKGDMQVHWGERVQENLRVAVGLAVQKLQVSEACKLVFAGKGAMTETTFGQVAQEAQNL